jgi:hypothetical protein
MTRTQKSIAWLVGLAAASAAVVVGLNVALTQNVKPSSPPPLAPAPGTIVTTLTPGVTYRIAGTLAPGIAVDAASLTAVLNSSGWRNAVVQAFTAPVGPVPDTYTAVGTWGGAAGAPVPAGMVATTA